MSIRLQPHSLATNGRSRDIVSRSVPKLYAIIEHADSKKLP